MNTPGSNAHTHVRMDRLDANVGPSLALWEGGEKGTGLRERESLWSSYKRPPGLSAWRINLGDTGAGPRFWVFGSRGSRQPNTDNRTRGVPYKCQGSGAVRAPLQTDMVLDLSAAGCRGLCASHRRIVPCCHVPPLCY